MSDLTQCNYCTFEAIKKRMKQKGKKVTVRKNIANSWIDVFVDDKYYGTSFMKLTDHCVC